MKMTKGKEQISWQGIGISSNPYQKENPLSAHLLAYLQESAGTADKHRVIIADDMQVSNYMALHGLSEKKARKIALKKGRRKARSIEKICKVNNLDNIEVERFNDVWGEEQKKVLEQITNIYENVPEIRKAVDSTVPKRLRQRAGSDLISEYALKELALILSLPGVKFGHEKEKSYDDVAKMLYEKHGIGKNPEFCYSGLGLEFIPGRNGRVEPYSSLVFDKRILLTDTKRGFLRKVRGLPAKAANKLRKYIKETWGIGNGEFADEFYDNVIKPTRKAFVRPRKMALATAAGFVIISALSGSGAYIHTDANAIRQKHMEDIPGFVFSGDVERCRKALADKKALANQEVQNKYFIKNYFKK